MRLESSVLLVTGLVISFGTVAAQDSDSSFVSNQGWFDFYSYWHVKPTIQFYGDTGIRYRHNDPSWWTVNTRPSVRFMQGNWIEPRGGIGFFYTFNQNISDRFEVRPWQGALVRWPTLAHRLNFKHYFRLEERLLFQTQNDWDFSAKLRLRYQIGTRIPLPIIGRHDLSLPLTAEWFVRIQGSVNESFSDRARYTVGIADKVNDMWSVELLFTVQNSRVGDDKTFSVSDKLFQLKVRHFIRNRDIRTRMSTDDQ